MGQEKSFYNVAWLTHQCNNYKYGCNGKKWSTVLLSGRATFTHILSTRSIIYYNNHDACVFVFHFLVIFFVIYPSQCYLPVGTWRGLLNSPQLSRHQYTGWYNVKNARKLTQKQPLQYILRGKQCKLVCECELLNFPRNNGCLPHERWNMCQIIKGGWCINQGSRGGGVSKKAKVSWCWLLT